MKITVWLLLLVALMGVFLFVVSIVGMFYGAYQWAIGALFGVALVMAATGEAQKNKL